jgi:hypothetical protein
LYNVLGSAKDSGRRTYRYAELAQRLTTKAERLDTVATEAAAVRGVEEVEDLLLDEIMEWYLYEEQNGAH